MRVEPSLEDCPHAFDRLGGSNAIHPPDPDANRGSITAADESASPGGNDGNTSFVSRFPLPNQLAASIIHEINQPLAAMLSGAEGAKRWLDRKEPAVAEAKAMLSDVIQDISRLADIVAGLRTLAGNEASEMSNVDLKSVLLKGTTLIRRELGDRIKLKLSFCSSPVTVRGREIQVQQVLVNLLRNSVEALRDHASLPPAIEVRLCCSDGVARFVISDNGPGLAKSLLPTLFDPFVTSKPNGMGIGLAISRAIVEDHGGHIRVIEAAVGASFEVALPLAQEGHRSWQFQSDHPSLR